MPRTLAAFAASDAAPVERLRVARELALAVAALHARGRVHGALSPERVLVPEGGPVVLAPAPEQEPPLARAGFDAPEVARGGRPSRGSDSFSAGALAWLALAGRPPFGAPDPLERLRRAMFVDAEPVRLAAPWVPAAVDEAIASAMERRARRRSTAASLAEAIGVAVTAIAASASAPAPAPAAPTSAAAAAVASTSATSATTRRNLNRLMSSLGPAARAAQREPILPGRFPAAEPPRPQPPSLPTAAASETPPEAAAVSPSATLSAPSSLPAPSLLATLARTLATLARTLSSAARALASSTTLQRIAAEARALTSPFLRLKPMTRVALAAVPLVAAAYAVLPESDAVLEREIAGLVGRGDLASARRRLEASARRRSGDPLVEKLRGDVACAGGAPAECVRRYRIALAKRPELRADRILRANARKLLRPSESWGARRAAANLLGELRDPEALAVLEESRRNAGVFSYFCTGDSIERAIAATRAAAAR